MTPEYVEEEAIRGDFVMRWAVVLLAVLFGWTELGNTATLLQIRTGQELAAHGFLPPRTDEFFSYTATERAWVNLHWLGDLAWAGMHAAGGFAGLSVFNALLCGLAFWWLGLTSWRGVSTWWGSVCGLLALLAAFPLLTPGTTVITVLGLCALLYLLQRWRESPDSAALWWLVPLMLVWSNCDPRAYLGLLALALYAVGEFIRGARSGAKALWIPVSVAILAGLVNPFPLDVIRSPIVLLRTYAPAMQQFGGEELSMYPWLWRPVMDAASWRAPSWHLLAAVAVGVVALFSWLLNRRRIDLGLLLAFLGLNALALLSGIDFAAVAVFNAAIAGLNAQQWYRENWKQEYTLDRRELFFSRAGRAVTVLALFVAAYWGVSGRMTGAAGRRVGFGLSHKLEADIDGYRDLLKEAMKESEDHGFHLTPRQGDLLVWLGRQSFTDSRLALFAAPGDANLLARQRELARTMQSPSEGLSTGRQIMEWADQWQSPLDDYGVTHVFAPLDDIEGYGLWINLSTQAMVINDNSIVRFWQPVGISGPAALLYRLEAGDATTARRIDEHLAKHATRSVIAETFQTDQDGEPPPPRGLFPRSPTFYETTLLLPEPRVSNDSRIARHYSTRLHTGQRSLAEIIAYCHQIVRHARHGLADDPNDESTYMLLGDAYMRLWGAEASLAQNQLAAAAAERRFYQTVFAWQHAAICDPESPEPHAALYPLYFRHRDYDLALQHLERLRELTGYFTMLPRDNPGFSANHQQAKRLHEELSKNIERSRGLVENAVAGGLDAGVQMALEIGCPALALELLERDLTRMAENPGLQQRYAALLLLCGRTQDGFEQAERMLSLAGGEQVTPIHPLAARANLAADQYDRAVELWGKFGQSQLSTVIESALPSLPLVTNPGEQADAWPVFQIMTAAEAMGRWVPEWEQSQWHIAMCHLEEGRNTEAGRVLQAVLESNPRSMLRPQIATYLTLLTGQEVPLVLPQEGVDAEAARSADRPPSPSLPERAATSSPPDED